eukprot:476058-Pyramimonas_sp.AAC.1
MCSTTSPTTRLDAVHLRCDAPNFARGLGYNAAVGHLPSPVRQRQRQHQVLCARSGSPQVCVPAAAASGR